MRYPIRRGLGLVAVGGGPVQHASRQPTTNVHAYAHINLTIDPTATVLGTRTGRGKRPFGLLRSFTTLSACTVTAMKSPRSRR